MSLKPAGSSAKGYCDPDDVVRYFDRFESFDSDTTIPKSSVENQIASKSSKIDTYTGHAFRARKIENEFHNLEGPYRWNAGLAIPLTRRDIRIPLDSNEGDKIELWDGSEYEDFVSSSTYDEGRDGDYWIESSTGMLHIFRRKTFFNRYRELRVSYRFGKEIVPADIEEACAKLVAADMMESDFYRYTTPGNEEAPDAENVASTWREQVWNDLEPYKEIRGQGLDMT